MTRQRTMIIIAASAALSLSGAVAAFAHAHLVRATPAEGGTVKSAPNEVVLKFNEKLEPAFSSAVIQDSAGKQVDKADAHVDKADRTVVRVSVPRLDPGAYTVEWRAMSSDTHKINGNFIFRVGLLGKTSRDLDRRRRKIEPSDDSAPPREAERVTSDMAAPQLPTARAV